MHHFVQIKNNFSGSKMLIKLVVELTTSVCFSLYILFFFNVSAKWSSWWHLNCIVINPSSPQSTINTHQDPESCSTHRLRSGAASERSRQHPSKIQKGIQHMTHHRKRWNVHYWSKPQSVKPLAATLGFPRKQRPQSNYLLCSDIIRKKMASSVLERCEVFSIPFLHTKFYCVLSFFMALVTFNPIVITPSERDLVVILTGLENYTQWLQFGHRCHGKKTKHASGCIRWLKNVESDMRNCSRLI